MSRVIFDIETAGRDFDTLEPPVQDYLLKWANTDEEQQEVKDSLSFYPLTGEIIAIGMYNPDSARGTVFFQDHTSTPSLFSAEKEKTEDEGISYETGTEEEIIKRFWETIKTYRQFVTFNGRGFDCPFIMVRSAVHKIKPLRDLMPNRYGDQHIDLFDQLTCFGATRRKFSLDMWCRTFGIKSPKEGGITGFDVKDLYRSGKYAEIARYCAGDLRATAELFLIWENYIKVGGYR
ncbi:MAG: 3'-5' exonuclease [Thermodesulfovibrio sp.]|nr:3'-5' exonuclease [Thermodesulfovibrio sp.]